MHQSSEQNALLIEQLSEGKEALIASWIKRRDVVSVFDRARIDPHFFGRFFAPRFLAYLLEVLEAREPQGDCPVMAVMLQFFKNRHLSVSDLYIICAAFRNTVVATLMIHEDFDTARFETIVEPLDHNFEYALLEYIEINYVGQMSTCTANQIQSTAKHPLPDSITQNSLSAADYLHDNPVDEDDIRDLISLQEAISDALFESEASEEAQAGFTRALGLFEKFGARLALLGEFHTISEALVSLSALLDADTAQNEAQMMISRVLLEALCHDLHHWIEGIFIHRNLVDVHALDESIVCSVAQCMALCHSSCALNSAQEARETLDDIFF
ncbi:MAG: hypothetical protein JXK05_00140 [Campylobacterales bacterium]|nr:hypothetical protein [Campylobacterales bacterium]